MNAEKTEEKNNTEETVKETVEKTVEKMAEKITELQKVIKKTNDKLNLHINRKFADIKVLNKRNEWEDYSGKFYITDKETDDMLYEKTLKHYNTYFKSSDWHRNKHLAIFLTSFKNGNEVKKQMITGKYKEKK